VRYSPNPLSLSLSIFGIFCAAFGLYFLYEYSPLNHPVGNPNVVLWFPVGLVLILAGVACIVSAALVSVTARVQKRVVDLNATTAGIQQRLESVASETAALSDKMGQLSEKVNTRFDELFEYLSEWYLIEESIAIHESNLFRRLKSDEQGVLSHVRALVEGKGSFVMIVKIRGDIPSPIQIQRVFSRIQRVMDEGGWGRERAKLVGVLEGDWILEAALNLSVGVGEGIISNLVWKALISDKVYNEELEEIEEYYPDGRIRRTRRAKVRYGK